MAIGTRLVETDTGKIYVHKGNGDYVQIAGGGGGGGEPTDYIVRIEKNDERKSVQSTDNHGNTQN